MVAAAAAGAPVGGIPARGEAVEVFGMRTRPELNGAVCQVVDTALDSGGCVVVRVQDSAGSTGSRRHMRIHVCRLRPVSSAEGLAFPAFMTPPDSEASSQPPWQASRSAPSRARSLTVLSSSPPLGATPAAASALSWTAPYGSSSVGGRSAPTVTGSVSSSAIASELLRTSAMGLSGGLARKKELFTAQRAAWKRGIVPRLLLESGARYHRPLHSTDATQFENDFCMATGGVPLYKAYPKEEVVLRNPKNGLVVASWAP
eukprot:CAMPEP_0204139198 /NCGR_PEP_ID=MMETSP0361-20130328/18353_1 /ASSEMBLY_ACC=CAM_ASM_000343 /TAXON_ID=268821 /ORGANISM="Scrippsiella Hangoei, Strain SHTV-5" /LENGTH=258 /DNA_ID=CAMNT_0051092995 /DNA_START=45 /DNA_END=821 /DNA_ORIENTATION=-